MAALESCPKHNMIASWKKTEGNVEFHEVIDFLRRSYIYHALTVSPIVSTTFVEQFWTSAKSKTINNVKHITAKIAGKDEGASSERLSAEQSSPSPAPTSEVPNESLPDSTSAQPSEIPFEHQPDPSPSPSPRPSPQPSPSPTRDHSSNDISLSGNEDEMTLPNVYDLCISLCHAGVRSDIKSSSKKQRMHKKYVSKQGRKIAKGESSVQRDPMFDVMPEDNIDQMETKDAQSEGRKKNKMVDEDKEIDEDRVSTEDGVSTAKDGVSTDFEKVSTDKQKIKLEGTEEKKLEKYCWANRSTEDQTKEESATQASQNIH
ncbi:hypothetical protein Tco_0988954 [Tanacetum coccineum]|uniref:Uncharacterized protein n=1 Tax=Tanacetum coccineum TaxID=301880 RepID=A0ABQ5ESL4_9ASTR